ncbi:MAG: hypothetical protein MMC33_009855 [Icmadophila ericetorum]|nr:hypothetical protein [Icmadophila ericetorum]
MAATTREADLIFNRANVALARSQRLIASWLPPRTEEELRNAKSEEEIEKEEQELFKPMPELLGLGATPPQDGEVKRQELSSNDKLRKQLLGKDLAKRYGTSQKRPDSQNFFPVGSKPRPPTKRPTTEEEDEDEVGRSALGKKRPNRPLTMSGSLTTDEGAVQTSKAEKVHASRESKQSKRMVCYLDQVLEEKARKKHKKENRKVRDRDGMTTE